MMRTGKFAVLTYDDFVEGLLSGQSLSIPEGVTHLMLKADAMERLSDDLGFAYPGEEEDDDYTPDIHGN